MMPGLAPLPSRCHPTKRAFRDGLCRSCYQGRPPSTDRRPFIVRGAVQRLVAIIPATCPKCGAGPPAWRRGAIRGSCFMCGGDVFVPCGRIVDRAYGSHSYEEGDA